MPIRSPGIPARQAFQHALAPDAIVVVLGVGGSSPSLTPSKAALTSGFTRLLPGARPAGSSDWGNRCYPDPVMGPPSCANCEAEWGKPMPVAPTSLRCTDAPQRWQAGPPAGPPTGPSLICLRWASSPFAPLRVELLVRRRCQPPLRKDTSDSLLTKQWAMVAPNADSAPPVDGEFAMGEMHRAARSVASFCGHW